MIVPVISWNPVILLLHNEQTNRWHPILFWECPPPSSELGECIRWKSKGHHTLGFDSRDEAINSDQGGVLKLCALQHESKQGGDVYYDVSHDIPWDGIDLPASVTSFNLEVLTKFEPVPVTN